VISVERTVVVVLRARVVVLGAGGIKRTVMISRGVRVTRVAGGTAESGHFSVLRSSEFCRGPSDDIF